MQKLSFRSATIEDCKLILFFIKELAIYERMLDEVVATEDLFVLPEYRGKGYGKGDGRTHQA